MEIIDLIWILVLVGIVAIIIKSWVSTYNKFIYWVTKVERTFADIDVVMQQRFDMINSLAQVAKKYSIHEYKTIKDTIEARSRWTRDQDLNSKAKKLQEAENETNLFKIQAVFERYPKVRADELYRSLMGRGNISKIESRLRHARLDYNRSVQNYNERLLRFPRKIVASVHGFKKLNYLEFTNQEAYKPKEIFDA